MSPRLPVRLNSAPPQAEPDVDPIRVLVVDDEPDVRRSLARVLTSRGFDVDTADDGTAALVAMRARRPDVALIDLMMPGLGGLEVLARAKQDAPDVEVIMMTAHADIDTAVAAVRAGAYDFLTKPFVSGDAVALSVGKAAERRRLVARNTRLEGELTQNGRFGELLGTSTSMQAVYRLIEGVAAATSAVLILGESGTGKELVARAIHRRSSRARGPFVAVNCAAIPKDLLESELFGHVRGAFTGAHEARAGLFESARGGTLLLDEIGDLPLAAQAKLLRALQEGEIKRVGSDEPERVDVRVLAATNADLDRRIDAGEFRQDLYYRLHVIAVHLPPLRDREDDALVLAHHFLSKLAVRMGRAPKDLGPDAVRALRAYSWPGNVRELEHAMEHAFVLSRGSHIAAGDLPLRAESMGVPATSQAVASGAASLGADLFEKRYAVAKRTMVARFNEAYAQELLRRAGGNVSKAARQAGLDRSNFRRVLRKHRAG